MWPKLHACASHHRAHKNTRLTPLQRWHEDAPKSCKHDAQRMHTQNAMKMTNQQVVMNSSRQHHIALLKRLLRHQYGQ